MIRLAILVAIFLAVYPMIGNGWEQFSNDFEVNGIIEFVKNAFENLKGYDTERLYAYLAERYLSFWFKKYTKYKEQPWVFVEL